MPHPNRFLTLLVIAVASLALPLLPAGPTTEAALSHQTSRASTPIILISRQGGNIRPFSVAIDANGVVTVTGTQQNTPVTLQKAAVRGLLKLAQAERFFTLPLHIVGKRVNPDVAAISMTVRTAASSRTVTERGARNARFDQLLAVVMAAAQVSF
jgi:hypothetical protein